MAASPACPPANWSALCTRGALSLPPTTRATVQRSSPSPRRTVTASHDDATLAHVEEAIAKGAAIAEFPTTAEAAAACHRAGVAVLMGAPNVVRGGSSHSGNVAAEALAREGVLDILSSDYVPASLLMGHSSWHVVSRAMVCRPPFARLPCTRHGPRG